jgi:hypothetical protein
VRRVTTTPVRPRRAIAADDNRITWLCDGCGQPVKAGDGYVEVDHHEAHARHREAVRRDRESREENPFGFACITADVLEAVLRGPVRWRAWHRACDPELDAATYWIEVSRIDTYPRLVRWAGHLLHKVWIGETDWAELLEELGDFV